MVNNNGNEFDWVNDIDSPILRKNGTYLFIIKNNLKKNYSIIRNLFSHTPLGKSQFFKYHEPSENVVDRFNEDGGIIIYINWTYLGYSKMGEIEWDSVGELEKLDLSKFDDVIYDNELRYVIFADDINESETKKDACYYKVKSRYKVWPSAYASGALVQCREVGAENWGNKDESYIIESNDSFSEFNNEPIVLKEDCNYFIRICGEDIYLFLDKLEKLFHNNSNSLDNIISFKDKTIPFIEETAGNDPNDIIFYIKAGESFHFGYDYCRIKPSKKYKEINYWEFINNVYLIDDINENLTSKPSSEKSLRDWFGRKGAKGSTGGWVDCNAPDGDGGYKSCGRKDGEERSKYPACRPTPSACKEYKSTKGKSWGKKAKKESISEGLQYHIENKIPIRENIYRFGSDSYLNLLKEVRSLYFKGELKLGKLDEEYVVSDIGTKDVYNGEEIWLDIPISSEKLNEAKHNGREVSVNSPGKSGGKNYVYVKGCLKDKSKVKKITYGSSMPDKLTDPDRRKAFSARHGCEGLTLKDKCTKKYWSCRKPRDFADISGSNSWW